MGSLLKTSQMRLEKAGEMMAYRFKHNSIIAYRIGRSGAYPLYVHPECADESFPGEGEAVFAQDIVLGADDALYFPGEYTGDGFDKPIHNTCCGGCGLWFDDDDRLDGLEEFVKGCSVRRKASTTPSM